jgi:hypothetical protein
VTWSNNRPLTHPAAQRLTARLVEGLLSAPLVERRRLLVFVCGGKIEPGATNDRAMFLGWARQHVEDLALCLLSEDAYSATLIGTTKFINLSDFEKVLAMVSDCVLIFPESAGSYSELGIFATVDQIRDKTLIANRASHLLHDSFLMKGPLHTINTSSRFQPGVVFDPTSSAGPPFPEQVWTRIKENTAHYQARRQPSDQHFVDMPWMDQIAVLSWILSITCIAKFGDLLHIIRLAYTKKRNDSQSLKNALSLMLALQQLTDLGNELYRTVLKPDYDLNVKGKMPKLSAQFKIFWMKEFPNLWGR